MPYDDNEKLKDQVGVLVGLFKSQDDGIKKLTTIQLVQLGRSAVPILKNVLDDMLRNKKEEDQRRLEAKQAEEKKKAERQRNMIYGESFEVEEPKRRIGFGYYKDESKFSSEIVKGVLETLSFLADDTLVESFAVWVPMKAAVEGLIKIGTKNAFDGAIPSLSDLFELKHKEHDFWRNRNEEIKFYLLNLDYISSHHYTIKEFEEKDYSFVKEKIVKEIASFVDSKVISEFILRYEHLDSGLKDLVADLILKLDESKYIEQILKWIGNGDYEDVARLSSIVINHGVKIDRELSERLFSKFITHHTEVGNFLQYLADNAVIEGNVDMGINIILKLPETNPKDLEITKFILRRLQKKREESIAYISKLLTDKNKEKVKSTSILLNLLTQGTF